MYDTNQKELRWTAGQYAPLGSLLGLSAAYAALILIAAAATGVSAPMTGATFAVAVAMIALEVRRTYPHDRFGACNAVTLARTAMVAFLCGAVVVASTLSAWVVFAVAVVALSLDGVDGWLARRSGLVSNFGARFDMETDSAFAAVLAVWLLIKGIAGPEVLVLGFARYLFVAVGWVVPALQGDLPPAFRRKVICVLQIAALILLVCPITPIELYRPIAISAAVLVIYSFGVDSRFLLRAAR